MRLRILELPSIVKGDDVTTPWMFIVDKIEDPSDIPNSLEEFTDLKALGCGGWLVFNTTVDLPAVDD